MAYAQNHTTQILLLNITEIKDKFGISEIYPTKENGREWYLNMTNPLNDSLLSIIITKQTDGSWRISNTDSGFSNPQIRINVDTPSRKEPWRDVEMTGYIKIVSINSLSSATNSSTNSTQDNLHTGSPPADESETEDLAWYARGGKRNEEVPCEGTAYFVGLHPDGTVRWKKSIWWTRGYTEERFQHKVLDEEMIGKLEYWNIGIIQQTILQKNSRI